MIKCVDREKFIDDWAEHILLVKSSYLLVSSFDLVGQRIW